MAVEYAGLTIDIGAEEARWTDGWKQQAAAADKQSNQCQLHSFTARCTYWWQKPDCWMHTYILATSCKVRNSFKATPAQEHAPGNQLNPQPISPALVAATAWVIMWMA